MLRMLQIAAAALALALAPAAHAQKEREVVDRPASGDHLDRSALPQPLAQQRPAAPHLRAAGQARPQPEADARPRDLVARLDDLTWEFKLRKDVRFHDGSPFTADDVVFTLKRVPDVPNSPSSFATFTKPIVEAKVTDPHRSSSRPPRRTCCCRATWARCTSSRSCTARRRPPADYNSGKAAIGTGPYKFAEYIPNQRVVMKANYGYWGGEEPWDKVTFKILTNSAARVAALLSGDVHMIETVPTSDIAQLAQDKKFALSDKVSNRVIYVHLNQWNDKAAPFVTAKDGKPLDKNPFKDARVRKALSMAINRDAIAERIMEKQAMPAAQLLPDFFPGTAKAQARRSTTRRARRSCSPRRAIRTASRITMHGSNDRYINDAKSSRRSRSSTRAPASRPRSRPCRRRLLHARHQGRVRLHGPRLGHRVGRAGLEPALAARHARPGQGHGRHQPRPLLQPGVRQGWSPRRWSPWTTRSARR